MGRKHGRSATDVASLASARNPLWVVRVGDGCNRRGFRPNLELIAPDNWRPINTAWTLQRTYFIQTTGGRQERRIICEESFSRQRNDAFILIAYLLQDVRLRAL